MPLRNRLQEVISRYEKAAEALKNYKDGRLSEDDLESTFTNLRKDRKAVDKNNRNYINEQRRIFLGDAELENQEGEDEEEEQYIDDDADSYEDEDTHEVEEEEEVGEEKTGSNDTDANEEVNAVPTNFKRGRREEKLWKQYGPLWDAL